MMKLLKRTPLAWRNLTHNWRRLTVAVAGIGFAVVLMFTQMGFHNALFDSTVQVLEVLNADLILASKAHHGLISCERFDRQRIYQARGCPGVQGAYPFYIQADGVLWKVRDKVMHPIRMLACNLSDPVLGIPEYVERSGALAEPGTALFDRRSKPRYGLECSPAAMLQQRDIELCGRSLRLVGTFEMGTDFTADGNLILSDRNLAEFCPGRAAGQDPLSAVDLGVVQVDPGADAREVQRALRTLLPSDVEVYTKQKFIDRETAFWNGSTPIGYIFSLGMMIGFLVGVVVCYQILSADIGDHISEFATLKAMGYRNRYFVGFVLQEAMYLSVLSFLPALIISLGLYAVLAWSTGLLMSLSLPRAGLIFVLTAAMCLVSGCLAMRRVLAADPADLF
jgi:putative ABC transport system permease protein